MYRSDNAHIENNLDLKRLLQWCESRLLSVFPVVGTMKAAFESVPSLNTVLNGGLGTEGTSFNSLFFIVLELRMDYKQKKGQDLKKKRSR